MDGDTAARLVYLGLIIVALGGWVLVEFRQRMGQALRMALAWGLIFVGVMAGYGLWQDMCRTTASALDDRIEVPRAADGHYYLTLTVNGTDLPVMVDTGASGLVLSQADAQRLGLMPDSLAYLGQADTANGLVRTALVTLPSIELGPFRDVNFPAYVTEGALQVSLLGMDYLGRFRMQVADDRLILQR